jgi:alpha-tubulin suppressor-like RCC1 family protein
MRYGKTRIGTYQEEFVMKKSLALIMALLVLFAVGCQKPDDSAVVIGNETPAPVQQTDAGNSLTLSQFTGAGMVSAGSVHSLGARSDGTVVAAGHNTQGQNAVSNWSNVLAVAAYGELSAAVTADGKVLLAGKNADSLSAALEWTDIWAVAVGEGHILGLKSDGTVVAAGDNTAGQTDVSSWTGIVQIAAAGNQSLGLKNDGTVVAAGDSAANQGVSSWTGIVKIAAGKTASAAVTSDKKALSTKDDLSSWADVKDIAVGDTITAAITNTGTVLCTPENADASSITNAVGVAAGAAHVVVLKADGTVAAFGSDDDFQLSVTAWQLRPYMEDGFILGFAPGAAAARVKAIIAAETGSENIALKANGADLKDGDAVFTGVEVQKDGAAYATLVIIGDVNGDSLVNAADAELIGKHLDGSSALNGAALCAATIVKSADGGIASTSVDTLNNYTMGLTTLSQFRVAASASVYAEKIAAATEKNKDVVGYIALPGTNIDYPILYNPTVAWYYNDHDIDKNQSSSAALYPYYNQLTQNIVITGHNARVSGTMFHQLHHIQEYNLGNTKCAGRNCKDGQNELTNALPDLKTYKGRVFTISIYGDESQWEVFSMYETPADSKENDGPSNDQLYYNTWFPPEENWRDSPEEVQKWIDTQLEKSEIDFGVTPTPDEKFVTLFTCGNEHEDSNRGSRLYFFLHKVS